MNSDKEERFLNMTKDFLMYKSPFSEKHLNFYYSKTDDKVVNNFIKHNFPKLFNYLLNKSKGKKLYIRLFYHGISYSTKKLENNKILYENILNGEVSEYSLNTNITNKLFENGFMFIIDTSYSDFETFIPNIEIIDLSMINNENFKRKALLIKYI